MKRFPPIGPIPARLLRAGHILILLALCDFAARLHGGAPETRLYIGEFMRSVSISYALLWGAGLGMDYWGKASGRIL